MPDLYLGMSGYSYQHWKDIFYPNGLAAKKWLPYYSEHFNSVEINATFYRPFPITVYERWRDVTAPEFRFVLKGPKWITRAKLKGVETDVGEFFKVARGLGDKFSLALWQMPPSFKLTEETMADLEAFLKLLPGDIRQAIEFRNKSWVHEDLFGLLDKYKVGWVSANSSRFVSHIQVTGEFAYLRLHGPSGLYSSSYSEEELRAWATIVEGYLKEYDVYCYFNNDFNGYAIENGKRLNELILGHESSAAWLERCI